MAVLQNIRTKGGLIVSIVIGLALLAFIIGDFVPGRGQNNINIAEVCGVELTVHQYEAQVEEVTNMFKQQLGQSALNEQFQDMAREQAWNNLINRVIMEEQFQALGLTVTPDELFDLIQGPNPTPAIRQTFTNPQTGEFDRAQLISFLKNKSADPNASEQWDRFEQSLIQEHLAKKYNTLLASALYLPDFVAQNDADENAVSVNFDYLSLPYYTIADSAVSISQSDIEAYYNANKEKFKQAASRDIEYVVFPIVASQEDIDAANKAIENLRPEFLAAADPMQFARLNTKGQVDTRFLTKGQLPTQIDTIFDLNSDTVLFYQDNNSLMLARLAVAQNRPDSINFSQIVIQLSAATAEARTEMLARADSIKDALNKGADFAALALQYSIAQDVKENNGNYGWVNESMLLNSPMEELFNLKKGEIHIIDNQQAVQIIRVNDRGVEQKKVQVATVQYDILPSSRTEQHIYSQASKFAIENRTYDAFNTAAEANNYNKRIATQLGENDRQINGLPSARPLVRWAYQAENKEVSDVFTLGDNYVVATLRDIHKEGYTPVADAKADIEYQLMREKKGAALVDKINAKKSSSASLTDIADALNTQVQSVENISFASYSIPSLGIEPQLIAAAANAKENTLSQPIEGVAGVYLFSVTQSTKNESSLEDARSRMATFLSRRVAADAPKALRTFANLKDYRSKFY